MFEIINKNTKKRCSGLKDCSGLKGDLCPRKQPPGPLPIICTLERLENEPTAARRVSQRCSRECPGVLVVASLEETQGVLSRSDCVYSGYITQGCAGGALAVAMSLRARCLFFHTHASAFHVKYSIEIWQRPSFSLDAAAPREIKL
jgi:hypothetical protein